MFKESVHSKRLQWFFGQWLSRGFHGESQRGWRQMSKLRTQSPPRERWLTYPPTKKVVREGEGGRVRLGLGRVRAGVKLRVRTVGVL